MGERGPSYNGHIIVLKREWGGPILRKRIWNDCVRRGRSKCEDKIGGIIYLTALILDYSINPFRIFLRLKKLNRLETIQTRRLETIETRRLETIETSD